MLIASTATSPNALRTARLIGALGTQDFASHFYDLFDALLGIKQCTLFCFSPQHRPSFLCAEGRDEYNRRMARTLALEYVDGAFRRDPNCHRLARPIRSVGRSHRVFAVASTDFKDRAYRDRFYEQPGLSRKLVLLSNSRDSFFYMNFYRGSLEPAFSLHETRALSEFSGIALQAAIQHSSICALQGNVPSPAQAIERRMGRHDEVHQRLCLVLAENTSGLTTRELEVCACIMLGHSTAAIATMLGISSNTVATHRKRAYSKLGVNGQSGLFALYLRVQGARPQ